MKKLLNPLVALILTMVVIAVAPFVYGFIFT
jgi:hypothetical protein